MPVPWYLSLGWKRENILKMDSAYTLVQSFELFFALQPAGYVPEDPASIDRLTVYDLRRYKSGRIHDIASLGEKAERYFLLRDGTGQQRLPVLLEAGSIFRYDEGIDQLSPDRFLTVSEVLFPCIVDIQDPSVGFYQVDEIVSVFNEILISLKFFEYRVVVSHKIGTKAMAHSIICVPPPKYYFLQSGNVEEPITLTIKGNASA